MLLDHGGNIRKARAIHKPTNRRLMDFSSNINPLGTIPKIKNIIGRHIGSLANYPDTECNYAKEAMAQYLKVEKDNILIANGSNELIHLIPRALKISSALICQPAFSEYALSLKLANAKHHSLFAEEEEGFSIDIKEIINYSRKAKLVILCNPHNPTGYLLQKDELLELARICEKNKTYLLLDEVFIEFTEKEKEISLIDEAVKNKYLLILRSLTKFFGLPGLRIGYLIADKKTIARLSLYQPTWSVNYLAQAIIPHCLADKYFIRRSKEYMQKEKGFLFAGLKKINWLKPYEPAANFILCKILNTKMDSQYLSDNLLKSGILIRDCRNFTGLNNKFFRVAVRKRNDNLYLINCLKRLSA